jgi:tRNA(Arg) A34 adenosine deaminase TadA
MSQPQHITAIIYDKRGRALSIGQNSCIKTHPMQASFARKAGTEHKIFLHAEVHAITRCKDLSKAYKILVTRYSKEGKPMLAKPCKICRSAIEAAGIKIVEHT